MKTVITGLMIPFIGTAGAMPHDDGSGCGPWIGADRIGKYR